MKQKAKWTKNNLTYVVYADEREYCCKIVNRSGVAVGLGSGLTQQDAVAAAELDMNGNWGLT